MDAVTEEGVPDAPSVRRAELTGLKPRALKKRAAELGVTPEQIDEADDADDVAGTLIDLILAKEDAADHSAAEQQLVIEPCLPIVQTSFRAGPKVRGLSEYQNRRRDR